MKAPDKIYVEVCEDGIFAFPEPPFAESVEYIRADINKQPAEGLEEELKKYINSDEYLNTRESGILLIARHFAEWGAEHLKR